MWELGGCRGILTGGLEDRVLLDIAYVPRRLKGSCSDSFILISLLEVCKEWGGQEVGGTWRTLRVPDRRYGGHGHS